VLLKRPRVTACFFGDGAVAEGEFHESMNLAALWNLPVLFICENNLYAMGTRIERALSSTDLAAKARAYDVASSSVDGMDVVAVEGAARQAIEQVRGRGPYFLECRTYRFRAHSMFDAELYRDRAEVEEWKKRDPIALLTARLRTAGEVTDELLGRLENEVTREIAEAVAFAQKGSWESVENLTREVYTRPPGIAEPAPAEPQGR
jgi:TPP-dependent pyruvate/acetoin dehydrogenase alpha subunit